MDWMNQAVAIARQPAVEQPRLWAAWEARAESLKGRQVGRFIIMLPLLFSPALATAGAISSRYRCELGTTAILIAAERHRRKTGAWPSTVAAIGRDILPIAPVDPYSGGSFRMEHRDGQLFVYSIGVNQKDEHGLYEPQLWKTGVQDDVGTGAWDVALRGRAPGGVEQPDK